MHAALVSVTIDPSKVDQAQQALTTDVVPMVSKSEGFVAGYWLEPTDGKGWSIVIFDTEEHARAVAPPQGASPTPGVTVDHVQFRAVVESA